MKRSNQAEKIIETVNAYLKSNKVTSEHDPVFLVMSHALLENNIYKGWNSYRTNDQGLQVLSGGINT